MAFPLRFHWFAWHVRVPVFILTDTVFNGYTGLVLILHKSRWTDTHVDTLLRQGTPSNGCLGTGHAERLIDQLLTGIPIDLTTLTDSWTEIK